MSTSPTRRLYVQKVLGLYRCAPGTKGALGRSDRALAGTLYDRGVSINVVVGAIILAVARRTFRSATAAPLDPIASLHYFRPVIEELLVEPTVPGYLDYLKHKLHAVAPDFATAIDHQLP
jgi:hypothetical protein